MLMRKWICMTLVALFLMSTVVSAQGVAGDTTVLAKTATIEKMLYGNEQTGSLVERVNKLENEIYGMTTKEALVTKLDRIYSYMTETSSAQPSFLTKLDAVEWSLTHGVTIDPAKTRIDNLEQTILGSAQSGCFDERLAKLMKLSFADGRVDVDMETLAKDTLIKIKMVTPLDSKTNRAGDEVIFEAADDVFVNSALVIPRGSRGVGKVLNVEEAKNFGRDAKLEIAFEKVQAADGSNVETILGDKAREETKSLAAAAGASVAGIALLGPIGIVGGAFVHGKNITIPAGTELFIQVKNDTELYGISMK